MKEDYPMRRMMISCFILCFTLLCTSVASGQFYKRGLIPVKVPAGGFAVDGDAYANTCPDEAAAPNNFGDWFPSPGPAGSIFTSLGLVDYATYPELTGMIAHYVDNFNTGDVNVFGESNKISDNPETYLVKPGNVPPKDDMQHATGFFTYANTALTGMVRNPDGSLTPFPAVEGELWCVFAADRWQVNGDSYIDFEFNQAIMQLNDDGTFTSFAPDVDVNGDPTGGRTPGDILVTINFEGGGKIANLFIDKWENDGPGTVYDWVRKNVDIDLPANTVFCTHNLGNCPAPWSIYDQPAPYVYSVNQYAEGAINITRLMGDSKCGHISTIWVRTKSSASPNAELKDLAGPPFNIDLPFEGPLASCPDDVINPVCTPVDMLEEAYDNWKLDFTYTLGTGQATVTETFNPPLSADLPDNVECEGLELTVVYTVTDECDLTSSCTSSFTVLPDDLPPVLPVLPRGGDLGCNPDPPACLTGLVAEDQCSGQVPVTCVPGPVEGAACQKTQVFTYSATDDCGNSASAKVTFTWTADTQSPTTANCPEVRDLGCNPEPAEWAPGTVIWADNCGVSDHGVIPGQPAPAAQGCGWRVTHTHWAEDACGNSAECQEVITWVVDTQPPTTANCPEEEDLGCNPDEEEWLPTRVTWSDNCGVTENGIIAGSPIADAEGCGWSVTHTHWAEDACDNRTTCKEVFTWIVDLTPPVLSNVPDGGDLGCNPEVLPACDPAVKASDNCDGDVAVTCVGGQIVDLLPCGKSQDFTYSAIDLCGNIISETVTFRWKVDLEPPKPDMELTDLEFSCDEPVILPVPVFTDDCDGIIPFTCAVTGATGEDCYTYQYPIGETEICFTAEDECENSITICIKVTVLPCGEFCTYTQGFYGSQKGTACNLEEEVRGDLFTAALLAEGNLVLGSAGNTVTFTPGTASLIREILPGGTESKTITGICIPTYANRSCLTLTKQGRIGNQLLAQTLVLGLNLRINDGLAALPLEPGKYLTTQAKLHCEESTGGMEMVCTPVFTVPVPPALPEFICNELTVNPYWYYELPDAVLCYMAAKGYAMTIQGLYNLANDVLGQARTLPVLCDDKEVNLAAIASAVDMINNAFDGCRIFVGNLEDKITCPDPCGEEKSVRLTIADQNELSVYPNPFSDKVTFEFTPAYDGHATLEIHTILGQKAVVLMNKEVSKGVVNRVEYTPRNQVPGILLYRLRLNETVINGRIVYNRNE